MDGALSSGPLPFAALDETVKLIRQRRLSAVELTDACLGQIERHGRLNAFTQVFAEHARERALTLDRDLARGRVHGPLHGIPVAVKDLMGVAGFPTTCGTESRRNAPPATVDADPVAAMVAAGAVLVGATNLHEWADGPTSSNPHFGPVRNPWDEDRVPGGSSGGSAVAVAAGMAFAALGTDTAGSVRIPAACTGTAALKATTGRISTKGVYPLSWTLDTVGPHGRTVADLERPYRVLSGDARATPRCELAMIRLGVERRYYFDQDHTDPVVSAAFETSLGQLDEAGVQIVDVTIPELEHAAAAEYAILLAEASAVHDGRYREHRAEYGLEIRRYLATGDAVLAIDYIRALRYRTVLRQGFDRALAEVDFIVSPGLPMLPPRIGDSEHVWPDGTAGSVGELWRHTFPSNLAGLPSLAQPCGFADGTLPVGLQLIGASGSELDLLAAGTVLEQTFEWSPGIPPGFAPSAPLAAP